jgi:hypothetical protein
MQRRPFHGPPPALTSTDPDTSGRAVEYRQMMRRVFDSPITGTSKAHISPLRRVIASARYLRLVDSKSHPLPLHSDAGGLRTLIQTGHRSDR